MKKPGIHDNRQEKLNQRALQAAFYYVRTEGATLASTGRIYNVSESTIHRDFHTRVKKLNKNLYIQVKKKLAKNTKIRHILGGIANSRRWKKIRREENKYSKK